MRCRVVAVLALIGLPMGASGQSLTSAVELCSDPMTTGAQKIDALTSGGWTPVVPPSETDIALIAGSAGPSFNADLPVAEMQAILPEINAGFANAVADGILQMYRQGETLLMIGVTAQPANGLEHLTCLVAAPPSNEIPSYWQQFGGKQMTPLLGRQVQLFQGTVLNARDDITYTEYQVWARVPDALSPLTDSYRYERLEAAPQ